MEPIKHIRKERKHLRRLKQMRGNIYTKIGPLEVGVHPSCEPLPPGEQQNLDYRPIRRKSVWGGVFDCAWFRVKGVIPSAAQGKHVVVHINVGGEGAVYDGAEPASAITLVMSYIDRLQSGVGKSVIEISPCAKNGEKVELYIDAGYNGYYNYPFGWGIFHYADLCVVDDALLDYYYDYLCIASLLSVEEDRARRAMLSRTLDESFAALKNSVAEAKAILAPLFDGKPDESVTFTAVGHSHLDLAWLWPLRETKRKAQRTFANQINNAARYPEYIYGASQPWQFEYIRDNYPAQYARLKKMAEGGQLEPQGGMWVEADTNLSSGEALIRQILYGTEFFREEFGREMKICWLPDVFGYNGNLPQILKKSGLPYFMTIKLSWNEHNRFPYRSFVWSGIDGSEVLVHMPPDETYNSAGSPACVRHAAENYTEREKAPVALFLHGIGDGGGGPGEAHIELVMRQTSLDRSPRVAHGTAEGFFEDLENYRGALPRYSGELYLEKHQGTYTTQGANKNFNRRCEYALQDLEALCTLAWTEGRKYPDEALDEWWKEVLLYQFHDIIPGSSITRVYEESKERYAIILKEIEAERLNVLGFLSDKSGVKSVFNPTGFSRCEYIKSEDKWYYAETLPYGFAPLSEALSPAGMQCGKDTLENELLALRFSPNGDIISLKSKEDGFEFADGSLNTLRLYRDKWLYYNAWDIDWKYYKKPSRILKAYKTESFIDGPRAVRRSYYRHGKTAITQETVLYAGCPVVYFETSCDYHETFKMLRADFDAAVRSDTVTCDIQLGSIERSTGNVTKEEIAQFEICAHKYVDVSDEKRGLSLLNDCKYGHRVKGNRISLNLLRSPVYPDKTADRGLHSFTYALYPHSGPCGVGTLKYGYMLNKPLQTVAGQININSIASTNNPSVVVETIKRARDGGGVILRLFESQGRGAVCGLETIFRYSKALETDLMENALGPARLEELQFTPFEIKTIKLI